MATATGRSEVQVGAARFKRLKSRLVELVWGDASYVGVRMLVGRDLSLQCPSYF